ncbi:uncharacterized protein JN550_007135 [Neoarthrinium moseri]|nr:uncharacterized protein JN550_007135 [Neoarthrinium moseri]KAI1867404.1 hypothetical protein JN550_007135 [Neoarthrinium moseri]
MQHKMAAPIRLTVGCVVAMLAVAACAASPSLFRHLVPLPSNDPLRPQYPHFLPDGTVVFSAAPASGGGSEVYRVNKDGSGVTCLSWGVSPSATANLSKPFAFTDGSRRFLVRVGSQSTDQGGGSTVLEVSGLTEQREMRIALGGQHAGFTQVVLGSNNIAQYISIIGGLHRATNATGQPEYLFEDARVIASDAEMKRFTADGERAIVASFNGVFDQGNADGLVVVVDLGTGNATRLTANPDYDEDICDSPNGQWLIRRPSYVPGFVVGPVFSMKKGTTNQPWVNSRADEIGGKDGFPLWVAGDGWTSLPVANWTMMDRPLPFGRATQD